MPHRIKNVVKMTDHSFCVFVMPGESDGKWIAHVVGHDLDNLTEGNDPVEAVEMAADLIRVLTGRCRDEQPHDFSEVGTLDTIDTDIVTPCRVCVRCGEKAVESEIEEI